MAVRSLEFGLIGKCDLVELWTDEHKKVIRANPVEFKRGRKKESAVDRVQLCAQALCLEEMFSIRIENGQLYYLQEHRRTDIIIDKELRDTTLSLTGKARCMLDEEKTPKAVYNKKKCDNCSLLDICMPEKTGTTAKNVHLYVTRQLNISPADSD